MAQPKKEYVNIHGRRGGRGVRPWILLPKLVSVAVFVGAYFSATVLWYYFRLGGAGDAVWPVRAVSFLFRQVIVPSLLSTLILGIVLLLQHPKVFIRRRWLQVKLVIVMVLPAIHFAARRSFATVKAALLDSQSDVSPADLEAASVTFSICLAGGLSGALILIVLGRLKPRLGQQHKPPAVK